MAPHSLCSGLLDKIEEQIAHARAQRDAYIGIKVNSMVDEAIIDALYRASQAGVDVDVFVRGICALRPGVAGVSATSGCADLGRFLEHSRCFVFGRDGAGRRAHWQRRPDAPNPHRRVEALVFLRDTGHIEQLVRLLRRGTSQDVASWHSHAGELDPTPSR